MVTCWSPSDIDNLVTWLWLKTAFAPSPHRFTKLCSQFWEPGCFLDFSFFWTSLTEGTSDISFFWNFPKKLMIFLPTSIRNWFQCSRTDEDEASSTLGADIVRLLVILEYVSWCQGMDNLEVLLSLAAYRPARIFYYLPHMSYFRPTKIGYILSVSNINTNIGWG